MLRKGANKSKRRKAKAIIRLTARAPSAWVSKYASAATAAPMTEMRGKTRSAGWGTAKPCWWAMVSSKWGARSAKADAAVLL